jgi:MFS family permease
MKKVLIREYEANIPKLYWAGFFEAMWFAEPIYVLYLISAGLDMGQVGLLIAILFMTQVVFEIPSSVWADKYSRKNLLVVGMVFWVIAQLFFLGNSFASFVCMSIFSGISSAFASGTESAITYDTLLNMGKEKDYDRIKSKIQGIFFVGKAIAVIVGVWVYTYNQHLPFILSILVSLMAVALLASLKEPKFQKTAGSHLSQVKEGFKYLLANKSVWSMVFIFSLVSASSDMLYNYYQPILDFSGLPIIGFIYIYLGVSIMNFLGAMSYPKLAKGLNNNRILISYLLVLLLASLGIATGNLFLVSILVLVLSFCLGSYTIYVTSLINDIVPSSHRATTLSIQSLISRVMMSFLLIAIGMVASNYSISWAMILNAGIALIAIIGFLCAIRAEAKRKI